MYYSGCGRDGLTDGQKQRTLEVYEKLRMPYKGQLQQQGRWVQPQSQQPQGQQSQEVEAPQEEEPQEKEPQVKKPQEKEPQVKKPQEKEPQEKKPQEKEPQEKKPQEKEPQEKKPQEKEPQVKNPQEKEPQEKNPQEKGPQDQQPQDEQGDWRQKQIAQLQSRMKEAWDEYRHLDEERRQQIQQQIQQNVNDCLERVDQDYKQRGESLTASMQGQYNQLQADRQGMSEYLKQFSDRPEWIKEESNRQEEGFARQQKECEQQEGESRQNLKQGLQKDRGGCRQSGKEDYDQRLQRQGEWSKNYAEELRKAESRAQQIINDIMGMQ
ncbi:Neurofilament medium polypeptide [Beauveria bassiana]|uniref:Neurofilament medium polypeptide n=1 Tax=Beauveria bassiana TaxID=176275 RepID=A0A2N6NP93_BEABA|nr:Neurofilament medium polypeptide [Beauveria bassiana]